MLQRPSLKRFIQLTLSHLAQGLATGMPGMARRDRSTDTGVVVFVVVVVTVEDTVVVVVVAVVAPMVVVGLVIVDCTASEQKAPVNSGGQRHEMVLLSLTVQLPPFSQAHGRVVVLDVVMVVRIVETV